MSELENKKIGFIGGGRMVEAIFSGMLASGLIKKENVYVADISDSRLDFLVETYGIQAVRKTENCENQGNLDVVDLADVVVIGTIPQVADKILTDVAPKMDEKMPVVLSIMGGITLDFLQRYIRKAPVIRIMPNTPMLVQEGAAGVALGKNASEKDGRIALEIFNSVGNAYLLPESLIDPLTSVSGCGPAYYAASLLEGLSSVLAAQGMLLLTSIINFFIPSSTGAASVSIPILAPIGDFLGVSRQVTCLAFQFGDGFSNMLWPTAGSAVSLGISGIPFDRWWRFFLPLFAILYVAQVIILSVAVLMGI